jgi:PKHD-type hydroxylase
MLIVIDDVLDAGEVADFRARLLAAEWEDGAATAGHRSITVKQNLQLPQDSAVATELGNAIVRRLGRHPLFISAALAERIHPPCFNRYRDGGHYGLHVDAALMPLPGGATLRSDLSATLFLTDPAEYDGGELVIEGAQGGQAVKLAAGSLVLYPSTSLHQVLPVTRGERLASFFWIQSAVPDEGARAMLFDLDQSIQGLSAGKPGDDADVERLVRVYHNLVRRWARV